MQSDLVLDPALFASSSVTEGTRQFCEQVGLNDKATEHLYGDVIDVDRLRPLVCPPVPPGGEYVQIPSRDPGRSISCRVARPQNGQAAGVLLHFHGGGMVIGSHDRNIPLLQRFANASGCVTLSAGYRLAPENPFPAPIQDCFDVADYLIENAQKDFGGPLHFIGGESAGAYLTLQTFLHIQGTKPDFDSFKGLILTYGAYSWSMLPSTHTIVDTVMLDVAKIGKFGDACFKRDPVQLSLACDLFEEEFGSLAIRFNGTSYDHHYKHPAMSPLYRRLDQLTKPLPPALFVCGTADPLVDDTILMSAHWQIAGGPAVVKFIPGAPHAFVEAPIEAGDCNAQAADIIRQFLEEKR